jgi:uncharacterized membrane protein
MRQRWIGMIVGLLGAFFLFSAFDHFLHREDWDGSVPWQPPQPGKWEVLLDNHPVVIIAVGVLLVLSCALIVMRKSH